MPLKTFAAGQTLTAADVNTYLARQAVPAINTLAERNAIIAPHVGMTIWYGIETEHQYWDGAKWVPLMSKVWKPLALNANVQHYGAPYSTPAYRMVGDVVELRGLLSAKVALASNAIIASFSSLYRPVHTYHLPAPIASAGQWVTVAADGYVRVGPATAIAAWISLDGVRFSTQS